LLRNRYLSQRFTHCIDRERYVRRTSNPELLAPLALLRAGRELLPARHLASPASCGSLRAPHSRPCAARRFDSAISAWRLATPADCSTLVTVRPYWSRVTPCHGLLRVQHLELRPACRLLRTRHLASLRRSRIAPFSPPSAPLNPRIAPRAALGSPCRSTDCSVR
jgi:hypothetical protein